MKNMMTNASNSEDALDTRDDLLIDEAQRDRIPQQTARLLSPREVSDRLGIAAAFVRDHATRNEPEIPVVRGGRLLRFRRESVEDWIRRQEEAV